jgi:hypothetical protein
MPATLFSYIGRFGLVSVVSLCGASCSGAASSYGGPLMVRIETAWRLSYYSLVCPAKNMLHRYHGMPAVPGIVQSLTQISLVPRLVFGEL